MATGPLRPIDVAALTPAGAALAERLHRLLPGSTLRLPARLENLHPAAEPFDRFKEVVERAFAGHRDLVCIMAAGIVVRHLAPHLRSKAEDPAVVVVDERGRFVISLLSGHLGGANALAQRVADLIGATPVITTATDVQGLPPIDRIAADRRLAIENLEAVRPVHMALLEGRPVAVVDPESRLGDLAAEHPEAPLVFMLSEEAVAWEGPGVWVDWRDTGPPGDWLKLRPRVLCAGIGCNRGTAKEEILELIHRTFREHGLSVLALRALASIELKSDEPGLLAAAEAFGVDILWFPAEELKSTEVPHPSTMVAGHVGTPSVCEAAALKAAGGGRLIVAKQKSRNATLAIAAAPTAPGY